MASLDELKRTFFDECGELLQDMETGLTDLQDGSGSEDTVHAVFRAVHSIKGGAGIFGFEALVEFAHVFETVLDSVRHGTLHQTPEVFTVLLTSSDMLADLVSMSRMVFESSMVRIRFDIAGASVCCCPEASVCGGFSPSGIDLSVLSVCSSIGAAAWPSPAKPSAPPSSTTPSN